MWGNGGTPQLTLSESLALSEAERVEWVSELWHTLPACELTKHGQDGRANFERRGRDVLLFLVN
jgi:hypothetical protein